jgi:hypothetical protein
MSTFAYTLCARHYLYGSWLSLDIKPLPLRGARNSTQRAGRLPGQVTSLPIPAPPPLRVMAFSHDIKSPRSAPHLQAARVLCLSEGSRTPLPFVRAASAAHAASELRTPATASFHFAGLHRALTSPLTALAKVGKQLRVPLPAAVQRAVCLPCAAKLGVALAHLQRLRNVCSGIALGRLGWLPENT